MIPSRKSTPIVSSALALSKSDYLLWNLSIYERKSTREGEANEERRRLDGRKTETAFRWTYRCRRLLMLPTLYRKRRCDICSGGVSFLVIFSDSSSSNPTLSSAAALSSQERSKLANNDFDWVSPPPVSEPAFTAPFTSAPTITSSEPEPEPADGPRQPVKQPEPVPIPTLALAPAPARAELSLKTSGMMSAGGLPSASAGGTLDGGGGPGRDIGLVLCGGTGPGAGGAPPTSASAGGNVEGEKGKETAAEKGLEKDVKGGMEVDLQEAQEGPMFAVEDDLKTRPSR
ncbi:hypothetical protein CPC08DRAFT_770211 [Agrocybe pediades]|nr:hypothetical protein CPC08DRAFT_770211 [Agrocybe pediades]